jgi:choline-sulfatase
MTENRPNIVVIMSDQHNAKVMGCAGDPIVRTPHLDELAKKGVRFTNAYCPYPLCVPSRMSFMTGQFSGDVDVWDNGSILASNIPTFAHALGAADYEAVLCGRMHFSGHDQFHGFEKRIFGDCGPYLSSEISGTGRNRTNGQTRYAVEVSGYGRSGFEVFDDHVTSKAIDFINARNTEDRPYCMVVGHILPHNPLICSKDLFDYYLDALPQPEPLSQEYSNNLNPAIRKWCERRGVDGLTPEQNHRALAAYYGLVTTMDANIGRIVESIQNSSEAEDTVVIYCSDHGDQACEHGMWWKSNFYEGSVGVPLIASWPNRFAENAQVDKIVNLIDIAPTLLEIAQAEPLPDISGRSLLPTLQAGQSPQDWCNETFAEYIGAHGDQPAAMLRSGPWKLMYYSEFDTCLLFNLDEDPREENDRAADPVCQEIRDGLLARLKERWSADGMIEGYAREMRAQRLLEACGHPLLPHTPPQSEVPEDANEFDPSQLKNWEEIRKREEI